MHRSIPLALVVVAVGACFVQWGTVRFDSDFLAMYSAAHGVVNGLSPWDDAGQSALLTAEYARTEPIHILPFGYPPWYVMVTFPLGWLDYARAGRAFMLLNLCWLTLGTAMLTVGRPTIERGVLTAVAGLYLPLVGLIVVGQYTLPVFAGCALGLYALERRLPWGLAAAALVVSFKWHVGAVPAVAFAVLISRDRALLRASVVPFLGVFGMASCLGLLLDPRWPAAYADSVSRLSVADVNQACDTCSSLAWTATVRLGIGTTMASVVILVVGTLLIAGRGLVRDSSALVASVVALTAMSLPYVRNYDFAILALPLIVAAMRSTKLHHRAIVGACWAAPLTLPFLPRGAADEVLGFSALALFALLVFQGAPPAHSDPRPEL